MMNSVLEERVEGACETHGRQFDMWVWNWGKQPGLWT